MNNTSPIFYLEGNISSGKTTLLQKIQNETIENKRIRVILEPVETWIDHYKDKNNNLLGYFYADTRKWAFPFQMAIIMNRFKCVQNAIKKYPHDILVFERSLHTDRKCFAPNCYEQKGISDIEWNIYVEWWDVFMQTEVMVKYKHIYLRTPYEVCYQRMKIRKRDEELKVSKDYLQQIEQKHDIWFNGENDIVIDGDQSIEYVANKLLDIISTYV